VELPDVHVAVRVTVAFRFRPSYKTLKSSVRYRSKETVTMASFPTSILCVYSAFANFWTQQYALRSPSL